LSKENKKDSGPNKNSSSIVSSISVDTSFNKPVGPVKKSFPIVGIGASAGG
jgi:hypothetical protein